MCSVGHSYRPTVCTFKLLLSEATLNHLNDNKDLNVFFVSRLQVMTSKGVIPCQVIIILSQVYYAIIPIWILVRFGTIPSIKIGHCILMMTPKVLFMNILTIPKIALWSF